jgi:hypothetical protein
MVWRFPPSRECQIGNTQPKGAGMLGLRCASHQRKPEVLTRGRNPSLANEQSERPRFGADALPVSDRHGAATCRGPSLRWTRKGGKEEETDEHADNGHREYGARAT